MPQRPKDPRHASGRPKLSLLRHAAAFGASAQGRRPSPTCHQGSNPSETPHARGIRPVDFARVAQHHLQSSFGTGAALARGKRGRGDNGRHGTKSFMGYIDRQRAWHRDQTTMAETERPAPSQAEIRNLPRITIGGVGSTRWASRVHPASQKALCTPRACKCFQLSTGIRPVKHHDVHRTTSRVRQVRV